ncbi:hypothetical protein, partial [Pseudoneobacillus sp. C159]
MIINTVMFTAMTAVRRKACANAVTLAIVILANAVIPVRSIHVNVALPVKRHPDTVNAATNVIHTRVNVVRTAINPIDIANAVTPVGIIHASAVLPAMNILASAALPAMTIHASAAPPVMITHASAAPP